MKRLDLYKELVRINGERHQNAVAMGELGELINELSKVLRGKGNNMHICEEIADVEIVLEQLKLMHDPTDTKVHMFKQFKLSRLTRYNIKDGEK
jgi:hypothetical protein